MIGTTKRKNLPVYLLTIISSVLLVIHSFSFNGLKVEAAQNTSPGGVGEDLISWVEMQRSVELGEVDGTTVTKLTDLADADREWTPYNTSRTQSLEKLGESYINFHPITVPTNQGETVQYKTNSAFNTPSDDQREVFSVQIASSGGFPWELGGDSLGGAKLHHDGIHAHFGSTATKTFTPSEDVSTPHILNVSSAPENWLLSLNGNNEYSESSNHVHWGNMGSSNGYHYIGAGHHSTFKDGNIAEVLVFNTKLDDVQRKKVHSYLAFKYGITLKNDQGNMTDYMASDGANMWTASDNEDYGARITGLGRDDHGSLYQKQSRSQMDETNITIAVGNDIETSNVLNDNEIINDLSFFTFSDNGKKAQLDMEADGFSHKGKEVKQLERIYRVEKTNWMDQDITFEVDKIEHASDWPLYLVVSKDEQFEEEDSFFELVDGKVTLDSSQIADGNYFTIASLVPELEKAEFTQMIPHDHNITLTFDEEIELDDLTGFVVKVGEELVDLSDASFEVDPDNQRNVVIILPEGTEVLHEKVTVSYDGEGNVRSKRGVPVSDFEAIAVHSFAEALTIVQPSDDPAEVTERQPEISGEVEPGSEVSVIVKDENGEIVAGAGGEALVDEAGNWTFKPNEELEEQTYTVEVTAEKAGKTATKKKEINVVIPDPNLEITAPEEEEVFDSQPTFAGITNAETITIEMKDQDGNVLEADTVVVKEDGTWSYKPETELADGPYTVEVRATKNGKTSTEERKFSIQSLNKEALISLIESLDHLGLEEDEYTEESWDAYKKALDDAKEVLGNGDVTQADIDEAYQNVSDAFLNLEKPSLEVPVDKSLLEDLTNDILNKGISEDVYTPETYEALEDALKQAEAILHDPNVTQEQVNEALNELAKAYTNLEPLPEVPMVDTSLLEDLRENILNKNLEEDNYTEESWLSLEDALNHASDVLNDENVTQEEVDEAFKELIDKYNDLEEIEAPVEVDKSLLEYLRDDIQGKELSPDAYTSESFEQLEEALNRAEAVLNNPNATQEEVDEATKNLAEAITGLVSQPDEPVVDKSLLENLTNEIVNKDLQENDYTKESWDNLNNALDKAQNVLNDADVTQEEVNEALLHLYDAFNNLEKMDQGKVDKSLLEQALKDIEAQDLSKDSYTDESWKEFEKALHDAKRVLDDPNATQAEVDKAVNNLMEAYVDLKEKAVPKVDKKELEKLVSQSEKLKENDYTEASWKDFSQALKDAMDILKDPDATQKDLDEIYEQLKKTKEALVAKESNGDNVVDKSKLEQLIAAVGAANLAEGNYTKDSWDKYQAALQQAQRVLNDPNASEQEVRNAIEILEIAVEELEKLDGVKQDKTEISPKPTEKDADGNRLPSTATNYYSLGLLGVITLLAGVLLLRKSRKKRLS